jgi:hypothetical protein
VGIALGWIGLAPVVATSEPVKNGFDLAGARVPAEEILAGGPSRDGIRSVDAPEFVPPAEATWVLPVNPVLGVAVGEDAHAYPVHLIERHQVVNDVLGDEPVVVTYDPLAGVPRAFRRRVGDRVLELGVSGLVYNHNFLLYDRETGSLWVQFTGEAIAGPLAGRTLDRLRIRQEPLAAWLARQPRSQVLVRPMPRRIDYRYSPFLTYIVKDELLFPVKARDDRFHAKEVVLGVSHGGVSRAYLGSIVTAAGGRVSDELHGRPIRLVYDTNEAVFQYDVPEDVEVTEAYWLAWKAFHPDTQVWRPAGEPSGSADGAEEGGGASAPE